MIENNNRIDEVLAVFQKAFFDIPTISANELLTTSSSPGLSGSLGVITVLCDRQPIAIIAVTEPSISPKVSGLVTYAARRARARQVPYLILSSQRENFLVRTPRRDNDQLDEIKSYPLIHQISTKPLQDLIPPEEIAFTQLAERIAADLKQLHKTGKIELISLDADFFVNRLTEAVNILKPSVQRALRTQLESEPDFAREIESWAVHQGIPADLRSVEFTEAVVRQAIYRLLGKIIFYQSLHRAISTLPDMDVSGLGTAQVLQKMDYCFDKAHQIDYHAVFRQDVVDRLPYPAEASAELRDLVTDLNTRDFAHLPQDVVGAVFERLIPPEDRHALGQFFTKEALVDLILSFCVRNPDDTVLDPTCGTGTFLIRAYDQLKTFLGRHDHNLLLGQLWGVDIAPFPAELATINLFRQHVGYPNNFPRILNEDCFTVVPGEKYRFPPLKENDHKEQDGQDSESMIDEPIPLFDAIVGNFPYINAANIDKREKGYLKKVNQRLAAEWLQIYPEGFTFKKKEDEKQYLLARQTGLDTSPFIEKASSIISSFSDLYVSLFWHAAAFLKPGGRMGIITSNAWLDAGFGYGLQRFFLENFKVIAILESRCEPWFEQAAVNTVITIVERCSNPVERDSNPVRFVKIKRKLGDLVPWDIHLETLDRWKGLHKLVQRIETIWKPSDDPASPATIEYDDIRVRCVKQGSLRVRQNENTTALKLGHYMRAPRVYYDLLQRSDRFTLLGKIAPPSRGSLTGNNEFYHFDEVKINQWGIESEFLVPLLKSPSESDRIPIDKSELRLKVFVCNLSKDELKESGKINTLRYIEWGEKQTFKSGAQAGLTWPRGAEVKKRKPGWYALPDYRCRPGQLFISMAYGERFINKYSSRPVIADNRLYFLSPLDGIDPKIIAAVINSNIFALFIELTGRVSLGDGALELKVEDARDYLYVPDVRKFSQESCEAILTAFQPLLERPIGSVFDEVEQIDRQKLDRTVLQAMGLDPDDWLPRIYAGLTSLTRERIELGKMRSQSRQNRPQKAVRKLAEEVIEDLLPEGPSRFPDDFLSPEAKLDGFIEIALPDAKLEYKGQMMGKEEVGTSDGNLIHVSNKFEVRYLLYAQANGNPVARLPQKPVEVSRTVNNYAQYLRDMRHRLFDTFFRRSLDQAAAQRFADDTWRKFNLPDSEI